MPTDGQSYLDQLASLPGSVFEHRFAHISNRLGLGAAFGREDLKLLHDAAYFAKLCNISINGLGGCGGQIKPENEVNRLSLENSFVVTRALFYATGGWQHLPEARKQSIDRIFLTVRVDEENLN